MLCWEDEISLAVLSKSKLSCSLALQFVKIFLLEISFDCKKVQSGYMVQVKHIYRRHTSYGKLNAVFVILSSIQATGSIPCRKLTCECSTPSGRLYKDNQNCELFVLEKLKITRRQKKQPENNRYIKKGKANI